MYKNLQPGEFLQTVGADGVKWAAAFMEMIVDEKKEIDFELMLAWFANAVEAGRSAGLKSSVR